MKNFIIYNSDGKIIRSGSCSDDQYVYQVNTDAGELITEGVANFKDHAIDMATGHIINRPIAVSEARVNKITELELAYLNAAAQDISYLGYMFQTDDDSKKTLNEVITAIGTFELPSDFFWVSSNNTHVAMNKNNVKGLAKAILDRDWANFQNLQAKKSSVRAAQTLGAINSISW